MHGRVLKSCQPSCALWVAKSFFIPMTCGPQTAIGHVAEPEPILAGKCDPDLRDTSQNQSPSQQGDEVWNRRASDNTRAHLGREVRSEVTWHVAALKPTLAWR
jgi:hypothetical protein